MVSMINNDRRGKIVLKESIDTPPFHLALTIYPSLSILSKTAYLELPQLSAEPQIRY